MAKAPTKPLPQSGGRFYRGPKGELLTEPPKPPKPKQDKPEPKE